MIRALIAWGIGFGGVHFLPTHGLGISAPPPGGAGKYLLLMGVG